MKISNQTFVCACGCYALDMLGAQYKVKCRQCGKVFSEELIFNAAISKPESTLRKTFYLPTPCES